MVTRIEANDILMETELNMGQEFHDADTISCRNCEWSVEKYYWSTSEDAKHTLQQCLDNMWSKLKQLSG